MGIKPNANFQSLSGKCDPSSQSEAYREYRRSWIEMPRQMLLRDFPMHLDIEATNRCNLRCTFCDKLPYWEKDQIGDMDFVLYKKLIDEAAQKGLWGLKLSYRGEPLLHRQIIEMVAYAKEKGILDIYFNTNGMLLDETMSVELIRAGLDRISVSVEGTDPVPFERERKGASFRVIEENVERLMRIRREMGVEHPKVRMQTVCLPGLDLEEYASYWCDKCDEVAAVDLKNAEERVTELKRSWGCPQLWQRMTIEWDGSVFPCNNDDLRLMKVGNARERSIYDCWHDPSVQKVRDLHKEGKSCMVEACNGCPWRTAQISKEGVE